MAKLKIDKKILFLLCLIGLILYIYRGVLITISIENNMTKNIILMYTNQTIHINTLEKFREISIRIRPKRETSIRLKYEIENKGCFRVDVDTYIEYGYVGESDIIILNNGNIDYRDKIYFTFLDPLLSPRAWRHKVIKSEKISCSMNK